MDENTTSPQDPPAPGSAPQTPPAAAYPPPGAGYPPPGAPYPPPQPPRSGTDAFFDGLRRTGLVRSEERWIGGVAGGIALRLRMDPLVTRGLLGVSVLLGGLGLVLYGLGWLLLPEQRDGRIHLQQLFRGDFDVAVLGGFALLVSGMSFPDSWGPFWWSRDTSWFPGLLWLGAIVVVVVLLVSAANNRRDVPPYPAGPARPTGPTTTAYPATPGSAAPPTTQTSGTPAAAPRPEGPTTTMYPTSYPPAQQNPPSGSAPHGSAPSGTPPYGTAPYGAPSYGTPPYGTPPYGPGGPARYAPQAPTGPSTALPRPSANRGPGAGALGITVALGLIALAVLLYAERVGSFDGPVWLTAGAFAVVLLGVAVIVSGLRGRTSGGLGGLAVVLVLALLPLAAIDNADWDGDWGNGSAFGDVVHTPTTVAVAEEGYSLAAGEARIDLTALPLDGPAVEVPVHVGAGDLTIVLPEGAAYTADIDVMAGEVNWLDERISSGLSSGTQTYESPAVEDGAISDIDLDITVGAGTVRVVEAGR